MRFVPARWYRSGRVKAIRLIVIHCTVSPESSGGAEAVARYFAAGERRASAHRTADSDSTVMSVQDSDTAFAAAGANADGIHLELVGYPDQSAEEWLDDFSLAMLIEGGKSVREWSAEYDVPLRWLTVDEVADGVTRGLCTHADVSAAFPEVSTGHYDPGANFPKALALELWLPPAPPAPKPAPIKEYDDMYLPAAIVKGSEGVEWWLTDGITKQHVTSTGHAQRLVDAGKAKWAAKNKPYTWPQADIDSVRTVA